MIKFMKKKKHKKIYRERSFKVEPMQGMVKDIFELNRFSRCRPYTCPSSNNASGRDSGGKSNSSLT